YSAARASPRSGWSVGASSLAVTSWPNGNSASKEAFGASSSAVFSLPWPSFGLLVIPAPCRRVPTVLWASSAGLAAADCPPPQLGDRLGGRGYVSELPVHVEEADRV